MNHKCKNIILFNLIRKNSSQQSFFNQLFFLCKSDHDFTFFKSRFHILGSSEAFIIVILDLAIQELIKRMKILI